MAESLRRDSVASLRKKHGNETVEVAEALAWLGRNYLQQKQYAKAETTIRECLAIREKTQPDAWTTFNTKSLLGGALLGQKKYADAETLLLKGFEGMKA